MKKLPLRSVVFSTLLLVVCGRVSHNGVRAESMTGPARDMDPHMGMIHCSGDIGEQARPKHLRLSPVIDNFVKARL
jgi:hypothetical protein